MTSESSLRQDISLPRRSIRRLSSGLRMGSPVKYPRNRTAGSLNRHQRVVAGLFVMATLFVFPSVAPVFAATAHQDPMDLVWQRNGSVQSTNWGGYAVTGPVGSVTYAVASWTVPTVTCAAKETSYAAFWVGIDGFTSKTVEQTGTDSDCSNGTPHYYAWYEFYPKGSKDIGSVVVHPGDSILASITFNGGAFTDSITDSTTGTSFQVTSTVPKAQETSAEFIIEAPTVCKLLKCKLAPLADFGTVGFGQDNTGVTTTLNCAATVSGVTGPIGSFGSAVQQITMIGQAASQPIKAQASALSSDGTSFTDQWLLRGP